VDDCKKEAVQVGMSMKEKFEKVGKCGKKVLYLL